MKLDATYEDGQIHLRSGSKYWALSVEESIWVSQSFGLESWVDYEFIRSHDDHHSTLYRKLDNLRWITPTGTIVDNNYDIARVSLMITKTTAEEFYETAKPWASSKLISAVSKGRLLRTTYHFFREGDNWTNTDTGETVPHQYLVNSYTNHTVIKG